MGIRAPRFVWLGSGGFQLQTRPVRFDEWSNVLYGGPVYALLHRSGPRARAALARVRALVHAPPGLHKRERRKRIAEALRGCDRATRALFAELYPGFVSEPGRR